MQNPLSSGTTGCHKHPAEKPGSTFCEPFCLNSTLCVHPMYLLASWSVSRLCLQPHYFIRVPFLTAHLLPFPLHVKHNKCVGVYFQLTMSTEYIVEKVLMLISISHSYLLSSQLCHFIFQYIFFGTNRGLLKRQ